MFLSDEHLMTDTKKYQPAFFQKLSWIVMYFNFTFTLTLLKHICPHKNLQLCSLCYDNNTSHNE